VNSAVLIGGVAGVVVSAAVVGAVFYVFLIAPFAGSP
jgi:hypothetical protein